MMTTVLTKAPANLSSLEETLAREVDFLYEVIDFKDSVISEFAREISRRDAEISELRAQLNIGAELIPGALQAG